MQRAADEQYGSFYTPHRHQEILRYVLQRYGPATMEQYQQQTKMLQEVRMVLTVEAATRLLSLCGVVLFLLHDVMAAAKRGMQALQSPAVSVHILLSCYVIVQR
jgi:hypothetical protein